MAKAKSTKKPASARTTARTSARRRLTPAKAQRGLESAEIGLDLGHADVATLVELITKSGGVALGAYRDPLGSRPLVLATLPLAAVQPTPFQRDLSPTHTKRLAEKIDEARAFLDPLIVVQGHDGRFWTPNGRHRLAAGKVLGLKQITVLVSPDEALAYRILALNTEKAHNLKDRSLEVIRMARSLAKRGVDSYTMPSVISSAASNWSVKSVSLARGSRLARVRAMRITSRLRSLRLCAFSVFSARIR